MIHFQKGLVSVILTTYNRKDLLCEALESILRQTHREIELIVIDNFSDYDFLGLIRQIHDPRVIPYQNKNGGIIAVNRNYGIKRAKGELIAFCDDDDLWVPDKLETQIRHFSQTEIIGVGSSTTPIGDLKYSRRATIKRDRLLAFRDIYRSNEVALSSLVIRNEGFLFDEAPSLVGVEDYDFQLNMTLKSRRKIKLLAKPLVKYRYHLLNESSDIRKIRNAVEVIRKYQGENPDINTKQMVADRYAYCGRVALRSSSSEGRYYFKLSIREYKYKLSTYILLVLSYLPNILIQNAIVGYFRIHQKIRLQ